MHGMDTVLECFKYISGDESHYYKITASLMPMLKLIVPDPYGYIAFGERCREP